MAQIFRTLYYQSVADSTIVDSYYYLLLQYCYYYYCYYCCYYFAVGVQSLSSVLDVVVLNWSCIYLRDHNFVDSDRRYVVGFHRRLVVVNYLVHLEHFAF